jgi:hypothetical protein
MVFFTASLGGVNGRYVTVTVIPDLFIEKFSVIFSWQLGRSQISV